MNPKYSVGESVILQSKSMPEYNGEYTVYKILEQHQKFTCRLTGEILSTYDEGLGYLLCTPLKDKVEGFGETQWMESALRKRHEPSQMSFQSLIQAINSPVKQES